MIKLSAPQFKLLKALPTWEKRLNARTLRSLAQQGLVTRDMVQQEMIVLTKKGTEHLALTSPRESLT